MTAAVFLDRDGTLVDDPGFLRDPGDVRVLDGVPAALTALQRAGHRLVVISNQSGIGRGLLGTAQLAGVTREVAAQLRSAGATIDAWYHCPHLPDTGCACRKPGTALHRYAAAALGLDLARSWCVGDRISDLTPAAEFGGRAILVRTGEGSGHEAAARQAGHEVVDDLIAATAAILGEQRAANSEQRGPG